MKTAHDGRVWLLALAALAATADGCSSPPKAGLPVDALDHAIADAIGDPATCVLLADAGSGKVLYRYGAAFNCVRGLPACDRPGFMSAQQALALAATPGGRDASCPSNSEGSRLVGWSEGKAVSQTRNLRYSAMMEGQTAMPGHEIAARLAGAFQHAGL
jgi:hypothetical protein